MTARIVRSVASLLAVTTAYFAYALLAVPWIEPEAKAQGGESLTDSEREWADGVAQRYDRLLAPYFPADHWARKNPKVLQSDEFMLLIRDFATHGDRIELQPCLLLFLPAERPTAGADDQHAIILDAPAGATLQFSEKLNLAKARIGKLKHGLLKGDVTIHSRMENPGPEDDLLIRTKNVQLTDSRIWTRESVAFRLGPNHGHGEELEIRIAANDNAQAEATPLGNLQSVQLMHSVQMHIDLPQQGLLPGGEPRPQDDAQGAPVEIACRGSFHFDLMKFIATFEDQVDVVRPVFEAESDQLTCEMLAIQFERREKQDSNKREETTSIERRSIPLKARHIEARGNPVIVRAPSSSVHARCQQLRCDLELKTVSIRGSDEVMLLQQGNEIHAPALEYTMHEESGRLGSLWASGPGWLRAAVGKDENRKLDLQWQEHLELERHDGAPLATITGRPLATLDGMGQIAADEMFVWLTETKEATRPDKSSRFRIEPDRMMAQGSVAINSPNLTGGVARLEAWFETIDEGPQFPQANSLDRPATQNTGQPASALVAVRPQPATSAKSSFLPSVTGEAESRYDIRGRLMRLRIVNRQGKTGIADITVDEDVTFRELARADRSEIPLRVTGSRLQVSNGDTPAARIDVIGSQAHLEARGMTLAGPSIHLNQQENRVWVAGAGVMTMPISRDLQGQTVSAGQEMKITWQNQMNFDGLTARFTDNVVAASQTQWLRTAQLDATLTEPIRFAGKGGAQQAKLQEVYCSGGVDLENRAMNHPESPSLERMMSKTLRINQSTGNVEADGPGWVSSVRPRSSRQAVSLPLAAGATNGVAASNDGALDYLRVDFAGRIVGNAGVLVDRRRQSELAFERQVRAVYGPVATWSDTLESRTIESLDPATILLSCEKLIVRDMPAAAADQPSTLELEALDDALVEGQSFTARADRMSYAQAKELLVLEGRSGNDARLWRQTRIGGPQSQAAARKILFWRATNRVEVDDARFFDLSQFGQGGNSK
ncbi:MAG: hypothetical protein KDA42_01290 [Planctomycetales bacterium]|nr:hypothetical protein [Planctomycetales bacterium]